MKEILERLNPVFENRIRLAIMSVLAVNDSMDFSSLRSTLDLTDGNLSAHVSTLERHRYVSVIKRFVRKKPLTTYSATVSGKRALAQHIDRTDTRTTQTKNVRVDNSLRRAK